MKMVRLIEVEEAFGEKAQPVASYLTGVSRQRALLQLANLLAYLAFVPSGARDFGSELRQFLSPGNTQTGRWIIERVGRLVEQQNIIPAILHAKALLELVHVVWERADEVDYQPDAVFEINLLKACLAMNATYVQAQSIATAEVPKVLPHDRLASLTLAATFADAELNNQRLYQLMAAQMIKTISLFEFLHGDPKYQHLLRAFLGHFGCCNWQEYTTHVFRVAKAINQVDEEAPRFIFFEVPPDDDYSQNVAFLTKFSLTPDEPLVKDDFLSLRTYPFYQAAANIFVIISPLLAAEMLHKGLYFRFEKINQGLPPGQQVAGWHADYCNSFSEQHLFYQTLAALFGKREVHLSGAAIKRKIEELNLAALPGEPDYYVRQGDRVVLFESKDVLVAKEIRAEQDYLRYVEALRKKFYYDERSNGKRKPRAILQLLTNIARLANRALPFDTGYDPAKLVVYPLLVVHDRLYNQAGLNVLLNEWFQAEMRSQTGQGIGFPRNVRPLVVVDMDTLIMYQDHFQSGALVLEDILEAYYRRTEPPVVSQLLGPDAMARFTQRLEPFSHFLENYAAHRQLLPLPQVFYGLLDRMTKPG